MPLLSVNIDHVATVRQARRGAQPDLLEAASLAELDRLHAAALAVRQAGLQLNAGHALDRRNAGPVAAMPGVRELHIGHSIVSRALAVGMSDAVREMKAVLYAATGGEA